MGAALATFAVSALHLSQLHQGDASWPVELVGHHASLPLAFAILYQDYPFALADLFLKRALGLLTIVAIAFATIATFGLQSAAFAQFIHADPRQVSMLVTLWVSTAFCIHDKTGHGMVLSTRSYCGDPTTLRYEQNCPKSTTSDDIPTVLSDVCALLEPALSAPSVVWREWRPRDDVEMLGPLVVTGTEATALLKSSSASGDSSDRLWTVSPVEAVVTVPTSDLPHYLVAISRPTRGRRFLSGDLDTLEAIAVVVARRIDAIRITHERFEREIREQEMGKLD